MPIHYMYRYPVVSLCVLTLLSPTRSADNIQYTGAAMLQEQPDKLRLQLP